MNTYFNPATVAPPFSTYSHGVEVPANARTVHISGQVGVKPDGTVPDDFAGQAEQAFINVRDILRATGMELTDLVSMRTFLVNRDDLALYREARQRIIGTAEPASTLLIVAGLAHPAWLIEVEAVAAKGD